MPLALWSAPLWLVRGGGGWRDVVMRAVGRCALSPALSYLLHCSLLGRWGGETWPCVQGWEMNSSYAGEGRVG